jgi:hypothetical protein
MMGTNDVGKTETYFDVQHFLLRVLAALELSGSKPLFPNYSAIRTFLNLYNLLYN